MMLMPRTLLVLAVLCGLSAACEAYYLPGTFPQEFREGEKLQGVVNITHSFALMLLRQYYSLPFCKPPGGVHISRNTANPGTLLEGLRIENSNYEFMMNVKQTGLSACPGSPGFYGPLTAAEVQNLKHKIDEHYRVNMILDNLPVTVYDLLDENQEFVRPGFELGFKDEDGKYYIYNHLVFNILVSVSHGEYLAAQGKGSASMDTDARRRRSMRGLLGLAGAGGLLKTAAGSDGALQTGAAGPDAKQRQQRRGLRQAADTRPTLHMVVGFEVSPCSIAREAGKPIEDIVCGLDADAHIRPQEVVEGAKIMYTYDVYFQESKIKWTSRWDAYLRMPGGQVHWFSIMNSVIVVLIMATLVALILIRTVRRDLSKYEQMMVDSSGLDSKEEAGWKMVTGDVFRTPTGSKFLAVQIASGVQIMCTSTVTLLLASLGFLSPASRGALLTATMAAYVSMALLAGFTGVYVWGLMERTYNGWSYICGLVSVFFPGIVMVIFTLLNLVIHHTGTTGAIPIFMYFLLMGVWFVISIPLTFVGGYLAAKLPIRDHPVKTNQIPRHIPPAPMAANPILLFFASGVLPFGTIFIELYFAMTSVWLGYFYYLFGFVFLIGLLTVVINAEISVLCTYVQLCAEDPNWWRAVAVYVALYAFGFLGSSLTTLTGFMPVLIYLSYMTVLILGLYFAMGTVGFVASYFFVHGIFAAVKSD